MTKTIDPRIIEQFNARAPFKWEDATLLVLAHVGSHSHNTYVPKDDPQSIDDVDYMGVIIPPKEFTLGFREWDNLSFMHEELDCVFYSFRKFVGLLLKSNPNVLGLLWMRPEHLIAVGPLWDHLRRQRGAFVSKRAYPSFTGYAHAQLKKMIAFDLAVQQEWDNAVAIVELAGWSKDDIIAKKSLPMPNLDAIKHISMLTFFPDDPTASREYALGKAQNTLLSIHARHFQGFMGEKRKDLVRKYGYDTKNAAHLIRLMRMCCEFFESGELQVYRIEDAQELRDIKAGKWTLERVHAEADVLFKRAEEAKNASWMPDEPNDKWALDIVVDIYEAAYGYSSL